MRQPAKRQGCIELGGEFGGGAVVNPAHLHLVERAKLGIRADGSRAEIGAMLDRGAVVDIAIARKAQSAA